MTVFGRTLDGQELFALASLLTLLVFWLFVRGPQAPRPLGLSPIPGAAVSRSAMCPPSPP